jgi:hypothetical protein
MAPQARSSTLGVYPGGCFLSIVVSVVSANDKGLPLRGTVVAPLTR